MSSGNQFVRKLDRRYYELTDHLGNVRTVIGDKKLFVLGTPSTLIADVKSYSNYYPFGMAQPGRSWNGTDYRYGYNGKEEDNDVKGGDGKSVDYGARWLDPRKARWDAIDRQYKKFLAWSPYNGMMNNPLFSLILMVKKSETELTLTTKI